MQYLNLGKTGMKVSRLCLGMMSYGSKQWRTWVLEEKDAEPFIKRALEAGINFFDTADVYSTGESERITGNLLRALGVKRENVVVATKVNGQMSDDINDKGLSRKHILDSIDKSLQRLQMDYVDLYQIISSRMNTAEALLEKLAFNIGDDILKYDEKIFAVDIELYKLHPPIIQFNGKVGVKMTVKK